MSKKFKIRFSDSDSNSDSGIVNIIQTCGVVQFSNTQDLITKSPYVFEVDAILPTASTPVGTFVWDNESNNNSCPAVVDLIHSGNASVYDQTAN